MKILQLVTRRQYRGAEVFAANLSTELIELGHEIIFIGLYRNNQNVLEVKGAKNIDLIKEKDRIFSFQIVWELCRIIRREKPDVVQCNGSDTLKYMFMSSLFVSKIPVVYRNISMISQWVAPGPKTYLYANVLKRINHVTSVGDEALEDFIKTFQYPRKKISVIRRGIPLKEVQGENYYSEFRKELGLDNNSCIAMHIGNFSPEKNHEFLLDVFEKIKITHTWFKLVCVGNGILFDVIKEEIDRRNLNSTVFLTGFRSDIPEVLSACDFFVLSSKVEGVPGVILEAGAQKKPAVSTDVGGVNEVIKDGETGFIIQNFDQEDFISKILILAENEHIRREMGENAYSLVSVEFNPLKNAKKFENLYSRLKKS